MYGIGGVAFPNHVHSTDTAYSGQTATLTMTNIDDDVAAIAVTPATAEVGENGENIEKKYLSKREQ